MKRLSESNKKILAQQLKSQKEKIPSHVITIMQKSKYPQYHLNQQFKNLQDPLLYNKSKKIQQLKKDAFSASKSLHEQIEQISQVSKHSYKQVMTPQGNRYDFDQLMVRRFNNDSTLSDKQFYQNLKARSEKLKKQKYDPQDFMQRIRLLNYPLKDLSNLLTKDNQFFHQKDFNELNETSKSVVQNPLNYDIIKQINGFGLSDEYKDVQFYQYLKKQSVQINTPFVSQFNLSGNRQINKPSVNPKLNLILKSQQFGSLSKDLFFDFDGNLNFYKHEINKEWVDERKRKTSDQEIMSLFIDTDMDNIGAHFMLKFAKKKINPWNLNDFKKLRKIHKKTQLEVANESLVEEYSKLLGQFKFMRLSKKNQRQAQPIKLVQSEAQTIYTLPDQEFDGYFKDDTLEILSQLNKLNLLRQRVIKQQEFKNKLIMMENICQDIKQLLFRLLLMMLKNEKFHSSEGFTIFGYGDLMMVENKNQAENRILKFIHKNIDKFQIQQVDNVPKSNIIKIYAQQRDKNNKILEIIRTK